MNIKFLLCLLHLVIFSGYTFSQILPDFTIEQPAGITGWAIDAEKNLHFIGIEYYPDSIPAGHYTNYAKYSANGDLIVPETIISSEDYWGADIDIMENIGLVAGIIQGYEVIIWGQIINFSKGFSKPKEFQISEPNLPGYKEAPLITALNDTTLIVAWNGFIPDSGISIYAQLIKTNSEKIGSNFFLNDNGGNDIFCYLSAIRVFPSGDKFLVIWEDNSADKRLIYGRIFKADGTALGGRFPIAEQTDFNIILHSDAAFAPNGDFAVAWSGSKSFHWEVHMRWFNSDGMPIGNSITISDRHVNNGTSVAIVIDNDGKGAVFWEKQFHNDYKLYGQRFTSIRELIGNSFKVSTDLGPNSEIMKGFVLSDNIITSIWRHVTNERATIDKFNKIDFNSPPTLIDTLSMDITNGNSNTVKNFELMQNYPNPFNPFTIIDYRIPDEGIVTVKIYDIIGNEITTLVNEYKPAGAYKAEFNAANLSSGVYIYTIKVNSSKGAYLASKKMIVLK